MSVEFLSKTKIDNDFLTEIINQLKRSKEKKRSSEKEEVLGKIIEDLELKINNKSPLNDSTNFTLRENEYNFLIQNKKSLWADYLIFRYKFKIWIIFLTIFFQFFKIFIKSFILNMVIKFSIIIIIH